MNPLHYPDIERCKKLTEIGFPETEKAWRTYVISEPSITCPQYDGNPEYFCPSVMEMLDVIPNDLGTGKLNDVLKIQNSFNDWSVSMGKSFHTEGTLPNAVADLILWLVENGYLKF